MKHILFVYIIFQEKSNDPENITNITIFRKTNEHWMVILFIINSTNNKRI